MKVALRWITPDADKEIAYMARVSNPNAKPDDPSAKLIRYLLDHKHFSPFEMACMCVEIKTTRDIARQILRHRSIHFQEFSQRYAKVNLTIIIPEVRLQDKNNRQNSLPCTDEFLQDDWSGIVDEVAFVAKRAYTWALESGIAKEVARKLLPEGLTPTYMYAQATIRDWLHYLSVRTGPETQKEHRSVAWGIYHLLKEHCPSVFEAAITAGVLPEFAEE